MKNKMIRVILYSVPLDLNDPDKITIYNWVRDPWFAIQFMDDSGYVSDYYYIHYRRAEYKEFDEDDIIFGELEWEAFNVNMLRLGLYEKALEEMNKFFSYVTNKRFHFDCPDYRCLPYITEKGTVVRYYNLGV